MRIPLTTPARFRPRRPFCQHLVLAAAAVLGCTTCLTHPTFAQTDTMPEELVRTEGRLSSAQAAQVRRFVDDTIAMLVAADDLEGAVKARNDLLAPLSAIGVSPSFAQQYGRELARGVATVPESAESSRKVNALLLLQAAPASDVLPILRSAFGSPAPSVRFTAANVAAELIGRPADSPQSLAANEQTELLNLLSEVCAREPDGFVAGKLIPAVQALAGDRARTRLIETLNQRVEVHAANPGTEYLPELSGMSRLFLQNLGNFQRAEAAGLCRVAARYLKVVSEQLAADIVPPAQRPAAQQMLTQADTILRELATSQLGVPSSATPGSIAPLLSNQDFAGVSAAADRWLSALAGSNTGIDPASLAVPELASMADKSPADQSPAP